MQYPNRQFALHSDAEEKGPLSLQMGWRLAGVEVGDVEVDILENDGENDVDDDVGNDVEIDVENDVELDDVGLSEVALDDVLERSFSAAITEKGVQVSGAMIGGSSGLVEYVKPGGNVELRAPSSPPRYGRLGVVMLNAEG